MKQNIRKKESARPHGPPFKAPATRSRKLKPKAKPPTTRSQPGHAQAARGPLTKERILRAAIELADESGVEALSMRNLAQRLGVEAMSLYNHVTNKDDILRGIVELVVSDIELPRAGLDWQTAMHQRAVSAHAVLIRHPWAAALVESQPDLGPARLEYCNAVLRTLRQAGFSIELAYNAFIALDSYIYGFALQEVHWPRRQEDRHDVIDSVRELVPAADYPFIAEVMEYVVGKKVKSRSAAQGYAREFEFGLNLLLNGLERERGRR